MKIKQNKYLINRNIKLSTYTMDNKSGYSKQALDGVKIFCWDRNIYVPKSLCVYVLDWYCLYLNHSGGSILEKKRDVCYRKCLVMQENLYAKTCKKCK